MAGGKGTLEHFSRGIRMVFFLLTMAVSLLVLSFPILVAVGDVLVSFALISSFTCLSCYGFCDHMQRYGFRNTLIDIPLVSVMRSVVITCVYSLCDWPCLSHGPYLGTTILCSFVSIFILSVKACIFTATLELESESSPSLSRQKLHLKKSWGMPVLFLSSLVFALGHVIVAYRTSCRARRKLMFYRVDPEAVLACKNMFSGSFQKVPRSPIPCSGKTSKGDGGTKRKICDEVEFPVKLLADVDSFYIVIQGLTLHYKISFPELALSRSLASKTFLESHSRDSPTSTLTRHNFDRPALKTPTKSLNLQSSYSNHFQSNPLYTPLLAGSSTSFSCDEVPALDLNVHDGEVGSSYSVGLEEGAEGLGKFGVVLVHGFGGGVFSWRHVMETLAQQIGCSVVAFDRPGWGLTSRPRRKDWEEKQLSNPYKLESQVDLLLFFCLEMGFSSVVLVGHDDGGLLVLKAAERIRTSTSIPVEIEGIVLLSVSLSREVVPAFARILLHTTLGKKHMVRPLLRTEITQVINRRSWYNAKKLTPEILNLYKAPLCVEGWDEALHEIGRLSFATVLSSQNAAALLKSVEDLPVLVVSGAEDSLVTLKSAQAMASKLINSRLVAISGCGHLPHEECPKALLAALIPFISRLFPLSSEHQESLQRH